MQRLTIIRTQGDPDRLLEIKRQHIDPVMERKAGDYGHILHVAARGSDGITVVNLWESAEASERAAQDPEIAQAREAMRDSGAASSPPVFEHYDVVDVRQTSSG